AGVCVADFDMNIVYLIAVQVVDAEGRNAAVDFNAGNLLGQFGQQGGLVTRAGADFEYAVGGLKLQLLCQARFDLGRQHDFVRVDGVDDERQLDIRKSQRLMAGRNETFAADFDKSLKDSVVVNLPGTD